MLLFLHCVYFNWIDQTILSKRITQLNWQKIWRKIMNTFEVAHLFYVKQVRRDAGEKSDEK